MEGAYALAIEKVLGHFEVSEKNGLSDLQVVEARNKYGKNGEWEWVRMRWQMLFFFFFLSIPEVCYAYIANLSFCSPTARTTYATMETCVGAIQRPAGCHSASFCSYFLWPGFI